MIGRIKDALRTLIREEISRELDAERTRLRVQVRELTAEMDDMLERFSRIVARQAKQRARDARKLQEDLPDEVEPMPNPPGVERLIEEEPPEVRKARMRARMRGGH